MPNPPVTTKSAPVLAAPHNSGERDPSVMADCAGADTGRASWSRELIKAIAADIGADMVAYIEVQYPAAIEATPSTFKTSVRNHIINQVMAAIEITDADQIQAWLADRKRHRREWLKQYRNIRKRKDSDNG